MPGTVSLAQALATIGGVDLTLDAPAGAIRDAIGEAHHLVVVLADGLGVNLLEGLPEESFLRRHLVMELRSVFPSSTAPALTSLATGLWPGQHGLLGWFIYLADAGVQAVSLPFRERFTGRGLGEIGLTGATVFGWTPLLTSYQRQVRLLMPERIAGSVYTRSTAGRASPSGYRDLGRAFEDLALSLQMARGATYSYVYTAAIDSAVHSHGCDAPATRREVAALEAALQRLRERTTPDVKIVVSADHGAIDVSAVDKFVMEPDDACDRLLQAAPSVEPRAPVFHTRPGQTAAFAEVFREAYGDHFALLTADEVVNLGLLGPFAPSEAARQRLGDFMAVPAGREVLVYRADQGMSEMTGFHGGMDPHEVRIPLIVA